MSDIDLSALVVSLPEIDEDHRTAVALWRTAATAPLPEFAARLAAFVDHLAEHFSREEDLMVAVRYRDLSHHASEHARVIGEANRLLVQAKAGRTVLARAWIGDFVPDWFRRHTLMLDSDVARVVKRARAA